MSAGPVAGLLLAAGQGRRFGRPKALVRFEGRLLVERAAGVLREAGCAPVVVVVGAAAAEVRARAALPGCVVVENPDWAGGMGSSLRAGLTAVNGSGVDAVAALVLLVDLPWVGVEAVRRVAAVAAPGVLAMAGYGSRRGHPVLLGREHWAGVAEAARGDVGARGYLARHRDRVTVVPCGDVADDRDVDTPEQLPEA